jgi:UDP-GlcNAc:undecaprenyl-phosphate/decaprenyl-phosphate GlcNAc-1-phosphate transferase
VILLFSFLVALFLTTVTVPPLMSLARRAGLVDLPAARKIHGQPIPLCGGLGVALGATVPVVMWAPMDPVLAAGLAGAVLMLLVGVIDDARALHYGWKFLGQGVAVAVALSGGVVALHLPLFGLDPAPAWIAYPLTALFLVGVTNAVNLADGLDGLAGGCVMLTLLAVALLAYPVGGVALMIVAAAVTGALLGFLRYNTNPATVFLGDTGSMFLGFLVAVLAVLLVEQTHTALSPALPLLLVGVPLLDTGFAFARRIATGKSPFKPDRSHIHHQLLACGLTQAEAVAVIYVIQGAMVAAAVLLRYESDWVVLGAFAGISLAVALPLGWARMGGRRWRPEAAPDAQAPDAHAPDAHAPDTGANAGAHADGGRFVERRTLWLRRLTWLPAASLRYVAVALALFLVAAPFLPEDAPRDIGVVAALAAAFGLAARFLFRALRPLIDRGIVFLAAGTTAYLAASWMGGHPGRTWAVGLYLAAMTAVLVVAIRVTRRAQFRVTPQDLLVLFLAVTVPNLSGDAVLRYAMREMVAIMVVLFYAGEFVIAKDRRSRHLLTVAAAAALAIVAARSLLA